MEKKRRVKKRWIILGAFILLLVGLYLALPYIILQYANKVLGEMEGYTGKIDDIDLHLYRGAYEIEGIVIKKKEGNIPKPFLDIKHIDLAIEWPALLKGKIVGEVVLKDAIVNFVGGSTEENNQTGVENDWTEPIKKLMPLKINRFEINNGKVTYNDFTSTPKVNLYLNNLQLVATNLTNVSKTSTRLPSSLKVTASSIGKGNLEVDAKLNILKQIPDFDSNISFTSVSLPSLNEFTKAYGKFDFEKGSLSLFSEIALAEGKLDGYIKPILTKVKIADLQDKDEGLFKKVWEGLLEFTEEVFQNQKKDQFATKAPIKGNIENVKTGVFTAILNILKNAFIEAFSTSVDREITFDDAASSDSKSKDKNSKKEERKENRKEKREERKERREEKKGKKRGDEGRKEQWIR